jgi:hypothetical protein
VNASETAATTATSGADCVYDISMSHQASPCRMREPVPFRADSAMDLIARLNRVVTYVNGKSTATISATIVTPANAGVPLHFKHRC